MTSNNGSNERTCLCLNVRICPRQTSTTAPSHDGADPDYAPCFVGDDGISIVHPQLTLRSRSPGVPIPNSSQCGRYATLSCLVCSTPVYRVYQVAPLDTQSMSGPLLPSDDWSETDALKSPDGWIEVHRHCSTSASSDVREWSTSISSLFKIHLPPPTVATAPTASTSLLPSSVQAPPRSASPSPPVPFLTKLRPIFLPAPFTPSHPVFAHLAAIATEKSQSMRQQAEEELAAILQKKISEIEQTEKSLRDEVETIWRVFRQNVDSAAAASHAITTTSVLSAISSTNTSSSTVTAAVSSDGEVNAAYTRSSSHSADIDRHASQLASPTRGATPTPGLTRQENFEPLGVSIAPRREPAPSQYAAHRSSLSASLVVSPSAMHAALGGGGSASVQRQNQPSLHRRASSSPRSSITSMTLAGGSTAADTDTDVSTLVDPSLPVTNMREEPFRRNMDPHRDMSASILVFTLEAEMAQRSAKQRAAMAQSAPSGGAVNGNRVPAGPSNASSSGAPGVDRDSAATPSTNATNGHTKQSGKDKEPAVSEGGSGNKAGSKEQINKGSLKSPRSPDVKNGKRKVTFDIKPEIREVGPTAPTSAQEERGQQQIVISSAKPEADMVFPFEEEHVGHDENTAPSSPPTPRATSYRLVEHPQAPTRVPTSRKNATFPGGLPASFSGLRPESLPTMASGSGLRRRMSPPSRLPSALASSSSPKQQRTQGATAGEEGHGEEEEDALFSPQEEELRKLFAADMPSHRSAWARGSKSWRKSKGRLIDDGSHDEDDEYDAGHYDTVDYPVASSLPVSMRQPSRARAPLSLSSYTPETLLAHNVPPSVAAEPAANNMRGLPSSVAIRKAAYNERDRLRSMDPGALDFVVDEDDEGDDDDDSSTVMHDEGGNDGEGSRRHKVVSPGDRGRQRALRILQKRSELPAAGLWRSLA